MILLLFFLQRIAVGLPGHLIKVVHRLFKNTIFIADLSRYSSHNI